MSPALTTTRAELEQQVTDLIAERDAARAETEQVTTELTAQLAGVRAELETAIAERDAAAAARDTASAEVERVAAELAALTREHTRTETQLAEAQARVEQTGHRTRHHRRGSRGDPPRPAANSTTPSPNAPAWLMRSTTCRSRPPSTGHRPATSWPEAGLELNDGVGGRR